MICVRQDFQTGSTGAPRFQLEALPDPDGALEQRLRKLRTAADELLEVDAAADWIRGLPSLFVQIQWFTGYAHRRQHTALAQLSSALEAYITDLHNSEGSIEPAANRTLAQALGALIQLAASTHSNGGVRLGCFRSLIFDAGMRQNEELVKPLEKLGIQALICRDEGTALKVICDNDFALVIVNLEGAVHQGVDFCATLRELPNRGGMEVVAINSPPGFDAPITFPNATRATAIPAPVRMSHLILWITIQATLTPPLARRVDQS